MYFQDAEVAIVVYDISFRDSFDSAKNWVKELQENSNLPEIMICLIGNKADLHEEI